MLAGQGVGPIRIGATVATIERLMAAPCEFKTPSVCRYVTRAVEFELDNGATKQIHVHRAGRPAGQDASGKPAEYGFFNGAIPPDLMLGMIPSAIQEYLGAPERVERSGAAGEALNVEVHHYKGLLAEYDRIENGNLILGGVVIFRQSAADTGVGGSGASPPASTAAPQATGTAAAPRVRIH